MKIGPEKSTTIGTFTEGFHEDCSSLSQIAVAYSTIVTFTEGFHEGFVLKSQLL